MPIQMVMKHGLIYPRIFCDQCREPIEKIDDGNVEYFIETIEGEEEISNDVHFFHKGCSRGWRKGKRILAWMPLTDFIKFLRYNIGDDISQPLTELTIEDLLDNIEGVHQQTGNHLYLVWDKTDLLYVGRTTAGVKQRILQHIKALDDLGRAILEAAPASNRWHVEIREAGNALAHAERMAIQQGQPILNKVLYREL